MSDELIALQDTATQARAKADELKAALTEASSDEERAAADQAQLAAVDAEGAFADAKAKAEADAAAAAAAEAEAQAKAKAEADAAAAAAQGGAGADQTKDDGVTPDANASRTGFAEKGLRAGDECICPDGRKGTVHSFDAGFVCIPNHDQG
jgi:hypothetical protein